MDTAAQLTAFEQSQRDQELSTRCLLAAFAYLGVPSSLYDVGCGSGHLVDLCERFGIDAVGVDLFVVESGRRLLRRDLNKSYEVFPSEMVICWELAEHLQSDNCYVLCNMLAESTLRYLLFAAAVPGQGGSGHVNEQPREYWISRLIALGLEVDDRTSQLSRVFSEVASSAPWYGNNLIVFTKE